MTDPQLIVLLRMLEEKILSSVKTIDIINAKECCIHMRSELLTDVSREFDGLIWGIKANRSTRNEKQQDKINTFIDDNKTIMEI